MAEETAALVETLDENTRRYYLEVMGIQCWQPLESEPAQSEAHALTADILSAEKNNDTVSDLSTGNETGWLRLEASIQQCTKCALHSTRKQALSGRGNQTAGLMFVFLSPDMEDDASGMICSGEANELFSKMLGAINISIDDVYITSLLKCPVPEQHTVSVKEIQQCNDYIKQQIQLIQPELLVVLGETAARCLLQQDPPLDELRSLLSTDLGSTGAINQRFESVPLMVTYSPQELLSRPENKRKAWQDLQQLQKIIQH